MLLLLFLGCFTSHQHASVFQGEICWEKCTYRHTDIEVASQTCCLTKSQYTYNGPTSPSADLFTSSAWVGWPQKNHAVFKSLVRLDSGTQGPIPGSQAQEADTLPLGRCGRSVSMHRAQQRTRWSRGNRTSTCSGRSSQDPGQVVQHVVSLTKIFCAILSNFLKEYSPCCTRTYSI